MSADTSHDCRLRRFANFCKPLRLPTVAAQACAWPSRRPKRNRAPLLSGSAVGSRGGRARAERGGAAHQGRAFSEGEDAGGVQLSKRRRICPAALIRQLADGGYIGRNGTGHFSGRYRDGENASGDRPWRWPHAGSASGCDSRPRRSWSTNWSRREHNNELSRVTARWTRYELLVHRRDGVCGAGGSGSRDAVPGDCRAGRKSGGGDHNEPAVFRVDDRVS